MDCRTNRHVGLWLVIVAVGGTSIFAPAAMARVAEEYVLAEAQRENADTPVEESDKPLELRTERQYLNWDRPISRISKSPSAKQPTAVAWQMPVCSAGPSEYHPLRTPRSDSAARRQSVLNASWPHAPPLSV